MLKSISLDHVTIIVTLFSPPPLQAIDLFYEFDMLPSETFPDLEGITTFTYNLNTCTVSV